MKHYQCIHKHWKIVLYCYNVEVVAFCHSAFHCTSSLIQNAPIIEESCKSLVERMGEIAQSGQSSDVWRLVHMCVYVCQRTETPNLHITHLVYQAANGDLASGWGWTRPLTVP